MPTRLIRHLLTSVIVVLVLGASVAFSAPAQPTTWCPRGYSPTASEGETAAPNRLMRLGARALDEANAELSGRCVSDKHPEAYKEYAASMGQLFERENAPLAAAPVGAMRRAVEQRRALAAATSQIAGADGAWTPYGRGPLITNDPRYENINGEGFVNLNGRVDSLDYDPAHNRLFASLGSGGVWLSENQGALWRSIGDSLPIQIIGAVAWTPAAGGSLVAVSGEPIMAGYTRTGYGVFYSRDLGASWHQSDGVPDDILGMQVAVDPTNANVVYAATSKGLYRSDNAGVSFQNVRLPTGDCAGKIDSQRCVFANIVTDVVVQSPDKFGHKGGRVLAVVGYRAGERPFPQNKQVDESAYNGLYRSETGKPGTFTKLDVTGFAQKKRIGKVELGIAKGTAQNHDYVYAVVQDAIMFRGGVPILDAPETCFADPENSSDRICAPDPPNVNEFATVLNGIYVSKDFGQTWAIMADTADIAYNPSTGSALVVVGPAQSYAPGIQAWYNQWINPDPTRQTADGIPTRVAFGLEEVWQNDNTTQAADGRTSFHVIGRYYADRTCLFIDTGQPNCPTGKPPIAATTTHPDQHDSLWLPDGKGGVTLFAGNDGGVFSQHVASGEELDNTKWGNGANDGFHTLLPYDAQMAKDGRVWFGLQDNGSGYIDGADQKQYMTFGGDGFWVAVDPNNSDYAWSEYVGGNMRVTTDGGKTWKDSAPDLNGAQFANPFAMDPANAKHLLTAGNYVVETVDGADTCITIQTAVAQQQVSCTWKKVFALGSRNHPGDEVQQIADGDVDNLVSAVDVRGDAGYVGYCGPCGLINRANSDKDDVFMSGIATNIGGAAPPKPTTTDGWHIAKTSGLPDRMITGIDIDPADPKTVYVTLGGYEHREWRPPGSYGDKNSNIGRGHVFVSHDAGEHFTDASGNLPDAPALSIVKHGKQIVIGTKIGAFISDDLNGSHWALLGSGLPAVQVMSLQIAPQDPDLIVAATFGRGVYTYHFPKTSVLGARKTTNAGAKKLPATGLGDGLEGLLAVTLAAGMALALHRRRRPV